MPKYQRVSDEKFGIRTRIRGLPVPLQGNIERADVKECSIGADVPVYFIDNQRFFGREGVYGYPDDDERFIFFSRALLSMLPALDWQPDVVHCNEWHTAIIPNWLKTIYAEHPSAGSMATVFTVHNLAYQGIFGHRVLEIAGIGSFGFVYADQGGEGQAVGLLGRGLQFADAISTVSEQYAREIQTPEFGHGMHEVLRQRRDRLSGILNGLDYDELDPAQDVHIAERFDASTLDRRPLNKTALQAEAGLPIDANAPLIGMITRLTDQKGLDILSQALDGLLAQPLQMVILGTGDQRYHELLSAAVKRHPNLAVFLTFSTPLAQKIYAGSDLFLMPSRLEPCGLGQLIAMRYGSVPIVRSTGGLADTVLDYDPSSGEGSGFVFQRYASMDLFAAVIRAIENYKQRDAWRRLMEYDMRLDFSWTVSAQKYVDVYHRAMSWRRQETSTPDAMPQPA